MIDGALWTVLLNVPVGLGAWMLARDLLRFEAGAARILAAAVLAWTWITWGMEFLGVLGRLDRLWLLGWSIAGLVLAVSIRVDRRAKPRLAIDPDSYHDREVEAPAEPRSTDQRGSRSGGSAGASPSQGAQPWEWSVILALALTIWAGLRMSMDALAGPVKVVSDGPIYHLYMAIRWWQDRSLFLIPTPFGENAACYFPANGDLWFAWLIVGWGGDWLAKVGQAPFWILSGLAAFALGRHLGAGKPACILAACWFCTCLYVLLFSFEPNVDTFFLFGYLATVVFLAAFVTGGGARSLATAGLAAGLAWGCKPTALVFIPPLLLLGTGLVAWKSRPGTRLRNVVVLGAATLSTCGYWFGRNLWLTGNPFYPAHLGWIGLKGWYPIEAMQFSHAYVSVTNWRAFVDILLASIDPRLMPVWLLATLGVGTLGRGRRVRVWAFAFGGLALANLALYWFAIPYRSQPRFMLHAFGLLAGPLALLFDRGPWVRRLATLLLAWHLLTPQPWPFGATEADIPWDFTPQFFNAIVPIITPPKPATSMASVAFPVPQPAWVSLVAYGLLGLGSLALAVAWAYAERRNAPWVAIAVAGFVLPGAYALYYPWGTPDRLRFFPIFESHARAWMALDGFAGGEPITVVYAGTNLPYYTFGPDLANRVRAVNINAHPDWLMHDYHRAWSAKGWPLWGNPRPGWDRIEPDESAWLANLRAAGADYLFVGRPGVVEGPHLLADAEGFPIERIWADRRPGVFTRVYPLPDQRIDDPHVRIYRISKPALQAMTL